MNINQHVINNRYFMIKETASAIQVENSHELVIPKEIPLETTRNRLRIAYLMNHVRVCGGAKIILEHCNQLVERGHDVSIVCRDAKPNWKEVKANYIQASQQEPLVNFVPEVDITICTVADQLPESYLLGKSPVVLFEQGDIYIYEFEQQASESKVFYRDIWKTPAPIVGVSKILLSTIDKHFNRKGHILYNALDQSIFYPRENVMNTQGKLTILFVGQENNTFKGIALIREALQLVRNQGYDFNEVWVAQTPPQSAFSGEFIENPTQQMLGEVYRKADIFISGSYYESFPLPPLEAMASGCAVVSTDNEGVKEYAIHENNCLLGKVGVAESLSKCIIELIVNEDKRASLVRSGYQTAANFNWSAIMQEWEEYLWSVIVTKRNEVAVLPTIKLEEIPLTTPYAEVLNYQETVLSTMSEDWCLFFSEGERVLDEDIAYIQQVLSKTRVDSFNLPVIYQDEVEGHPIVRLERRLIRKKSGASVESSISISAKIIGNTSHKLFLPDWKREVSKMYQQEKFDELITSLRGMIPTLPNNEKLVACRWFVLALLEKERYRDALTIIESTMEIDPSYTDLLYLAARIFLMNNQLDRAKDLMELASYCGTSFYHEDAFYEMKTITKAYLNELS